MPAATEADRAVLKKKKKKKRTMTLTMYAAIRNTPVKNDKGLPPRVNGSVIVRQRILMSAMKDAMALI